MRLFRYSIPGLAFLGAVIFFRVVLDFSYVLLISPFYEYSGFNLDLNASSYLLSWLLFFSSLALIKCRLKRVSDYFFITAVLGLIAPLTSLYGLSAREIYPVLVTIGSILIIAFLVKPRMYKTPAFPILAEGKILAIFISILMVAYLVIWYFYSGSVQYFNLDFSRVYEFRSASAELSNIGLLSYINSWVYQVFSLFLFSWFLLRRKFVAVACVFAIQIFFYGVSAHKSLLFYPLLVFGIWYYFRRTDRLTIMPVIFSLVVLSSLFVFFVFDQIMPASMFIRRVFYVPALLTYDYFSFFSDNPKVFWSNSVFSYFLNYPYDKGMTYVIGEYTGTGAAANNGFISSGYAHAGLLGILIYSVIFALILRFIDVVGSYMPIWFALSLVVVPLRSALISSDLFTVMLTHGLLVSILILLFVRTSGWKRFNVAKNILPKGSIIKKG